MHTGAGAYICGEETALLNSLEGKRGEPRLKPPFPARGGRVRRADDREQPRDDRGGARHRARWAARTSRKLEPACPSDGGARLYGVSGHVKKPGVFEAPRRPHAARAHLRPRRRHAARRSPAQGRDPRWLVDARAAPRRDRCTRPTRSTRSTPGTARASSTCRWASTRCRALGTMLGTCCAIVMDSSVNMVDAARNLMRFYAHESCGQCTPCREGTGWLADVLERSCDGQGQGRGRRPAGRHRQQHHGQHHLRPRRRHGDADARLPAASSARVRRGARAAASASLRARRRRQGAARREGAHELGGYRVLRRCAPRSRCSARSARSRSRSPIRAAMCLLAHILSLAGLYLTLHAHLLAAHSADRVRGRGRRALRVRDHADRPCCAPSQRTTRGMVDESRGRVAVMGIVTASSRCVARRPPRSWTCRRSAPARPSRAPSAASSAASRLRAELVHRTRSCRSS